VFSAVRAKHDSVGHLLESRCAAATSEVFEALRHRACHSIEEADVIERENLAGFSAPFNSFHGKLGNSHSLIYTRLEDLAATVREYCRLFGPQGFRSSSQSATFVFIEQGNQDAHNVDLEAKFLDALGSSSKKNAHPSDRVADALPQACDYIALIYDCQRTAPLKKRGKDASLRSSRCQ